MLVGVTGAGVAAGVAVAVALGVLTTPATGIAAAIGFTTVAGAAGLAGLGAGVAATERAVSCTV
jgi:hypothetical protein